MDPDTKTVQVYILENGRYFVAAYADTGTAPVKVLAGCLIDLKEILAE